MTARRSDGGFTLVELMVVVALIAVLAMIVVPSFFGEASAVKADSEVAAIFAEMRIRQENYKTENGVYLATGVDESDTFPATPGPQEQAFQGILPQEWLDLRFMPPQPNVRCGYVARAGAAGAATGAAAQAFGMAANPAVTWYYVIARCNLDGSSARDGLYFTSSLDTRIQSQNPGH